MKRLVAIAILCCMTVHCAGRLGILSWIYEQRHSIAYSLGFGAEKAIAECGSGYLNDGLVIIQQDDASQARPSAVLQAKEINLFFNEVSFELPRLEVLITCQERSDLEVEITPGYDKGIFHPPATV